MRKMLIALCLTVITGLGYSADVTPTTVVVQNNIQYDHVVWSGIPIGFVVPVGHERILKFPSPVTLHNADPLLTTDKVSIQNNNGFLYITAKKSFEAVRIPFALKKTGEVVLVDLSAKENVSDMPVAVVLEANATDEAGVPAEKESPQFVNYVTMMRFAVQHLYSPTRLIDENNDISRTPMYTTKSVNLFNNANVISMPLVSWRGGDLYVTAILLKNEWDQRQVLDPRMLSGHWLAASFYPSNFVDPKGSQHDRTTLFLISDSPFNNALSQERGYL